MKIGKKTEAVTDKESAKKIKNIELQNYDFRIRWIKKCTSENLEKYFKKKCDEMEKEETMASTIDGEIKKILMTEKEKKEYKRNREFYSLEFHGKRIKKNLNKIND